LQTTVEELVTATAYFDLFLRSVTDPGLLRSLVRFLLEDNYDDCRILDSLIQRISSRSRLCIVTLALFETLVNLNCEDVMLELCLGALNPCSHVMLSQRSRLRDIDPFGRAAEKFLSLTPRCCSVFTSLDSQTNSLPSTVSSTYDRYGYITSDSMISLPTSINYGTRLTDSLYGNYHAYLCDARQKIKACRIACSNWSCQYDGNLLRNSNTNSMITLINENIVSDQSQKKAAEARTLEMIKNAMKSCENDDDVPLDNVLLNVQSLLEGKDLNSNKHNVKNEINMDIALSFDEQAQLDADIAELLNENIEMTECTKETYLDKKESDSCIDDSTTAMNSLISLGESSGYESIAFKGSPESTPDNETNEDMSEHEETHVIIKKEIDDVVMRNVAESNLPITAETSSKSNKDTFYRQDVFNGQPNVGIFLDVILRKLECMTSNNLYVNLHLTGLISRLAVYPQPLLQSFLLNHSLVFQPSIRSLFQVYIYRVA
ncbi:PREDICTED: FTS and Hook-interacting protein homolog, partial [Wasmannia auropunctata]|uniref:FTS and Hook-interacting protein homolog n=1 Tax=Wasmannia auropunctata TaxID=64793 RepID=UPI0005F06157